MGLLIMLAGCYLFSTDRRAARKSWPIVAWGMGLQLVFAILIMHKGLADFLESHGLPSGKTVFLKCNDVFVKLIDVTNQGTEFIFGSLFSLPGAPNYATVAYVDAAIKGPANPANFKPFVFAIDILPTIIFFSALTSILYHLNIMQFVVKWIAVLMQKTMKTSGAETLSASANIFVGQTEAPLIIRPYLNRMTQSEIMCVMTAGFAGVAGGVMAAYTIMLSDKIPNIAGHLMAQSIMGAPAAMVFCKLLVPETETAETAGSMNVEFEKESENLMDAAAIGTADGLKLALNVGAMLIAFIALIALVDLILGGIGGMILPANSEYLPWFSVKSILGALFAPMAVMIGIVDPKEIIPVGQLLGVKMAANEFVAYLQLADMKFLSERSATITTYALCGFANFGSIGIQIGGLSILAPDRRKDFSRLALKAMIAGTLAANATACVAALVL